MVIKTILIFLIALLGYSEWLTGTSYLQRPIVLGPLVGLVMGDMVTGTIMGATMELAMVGAISVGAYNPPDTISGTILGVSLAMQAGADASAALTLGIPIATIVWRSTRPWASRSCCCWCTVSTRTSRTGTPGLSRATCSSPVTRRAGAAC